MSQRRLPQTVAVLQPAWGSDEGSEEVPTISSSPGLLKVPWTRVAVALAGVMIVTTVPHSAAAQDSRVDMCSAPPVDSVPKKPAALSRAWSVGAWFAGGTHQPLKTRQGHKEDRALYLAGLQLSLPIYRLGFAKLSFTPTIVPGIIATANRDYTPVTFADGRSGLLVTKKTAFGAGLLPIAIEATFAATRRAGLVVGGGGGAAYFDRRIPDPAETRFNFLANGHAGFYLRSGPVITTAGFWLQHISNGNMGRVNPGMDSRMLYVGVSR